MSDKTFTDNLGADYETSSEAWESGYWAALHDIEGWRPRWMPERLWARICERLWLLGREELER